MKIVPGFQLKKVAQDNVVIPQGAAFLKLNGMILLNETGAFCWKKIAEGMDEEAIIKAVTEEYDVSREAAEKDFNAFCEHLRTIGCIE